MPTYDYACEKCGHTFEEFQSITADALRKCPACRKMGLKRLIGAGAAIIFKGSGFYQTDYRSEEYKKAAKAEAGGSEQQAETAGEEAAGQEDTKSSGDDSVDADFEVVDD